MTINPDTPPSSNCRVVIRSVIPGGPEVRGEQFSILPGPVEGLDIYLGELIIDEHGHLIAHLNIRSSSSATYRVPFFIGSVDSSPSSGGFHVPSTFTRIEKEIHITPSNGRSATSHYLIDLGHVNAFISAEERRHGPER